MIRPFTCVCVILAAGSGLFLYQSKHHALMLDRKIDRTLAMVDAARQRIGLLQAEYALLNDPSRLASLAAELLPTLQTTTPGQFSTLADLDRRLPPVGPSPDASPAQVGDQPGADQPGASGAPVAATAAPQADAVVADAKPPAPMVVSRAALDKPWADKAAAADRGVADPVLADASRPAAERASLSQPARPARPTPLQPRDARLAAAMIARAAQRPPVRLAEAPPRFTPVSRISPAPPRISPPQITNVTDRVAPVAYAPRPMVGSALGMARMISPQQYYTDSYSGNR